MAFTAAKYLHEKVTPNFADKCMDIVDMEILSPVILELSEEQKPQRIRISATLAQGEVSVRFSDKEISDSTSTLHAKCAVVLRDTAKVLRQWWRGKHLISSRFNSIASEGGVHKLHRRMVYKLFGAVVDYAERFHGMDQVLINSESYEATAQVSFKADETVGNFFRSPYWIDSLMQLSGFVMNANETVDTDNMVYISHGWESLQIACELSSRKVYTVYVKMQPSGGTVYGGDMYILDDSEIVCVAMGIKFQSVPRQLLKLLLAPPSKKSQTSSTLKAGDTNTRTQGRSTTHNNSSAQLKPTSTSQSSTRQLLTPLTSTNTNSTYGNALDVIDSSSKAKRSELSTLMLNVLGEELGMEVQGLEENTTFAEMGVDSLMSLTVVGRLRESFDLDIPSTIFQNYPTVNRLVKSLEDEYGGDLDDEGSEASITTTTTARGSIDSRSSNEEELVFEAPKAPTSKHRATSIMLQGNIRTAKDNLFLFPGGFGASSSFAPMPYIDKDLAVFGLNSAFVNAPEDFTITVPEMASLYLGEVRRRQPQGPYSLLGYSIGGVIAYEAARQLIMAGEVVANLYLVDSPCPLVIPPMPPKLIEFLDSIDRFSGTKLKAEEPKEAVKPMGSLHVTQSLTALESYFPEPLPDMALSPTTTYYVAKDGVSNETTLDLPDISESDRKVMAWLLHDRIGLGGTGDGWEKLVGSARLKVFPIQGNHFNIMKEPHVSIIRVLQVVSKLMVAN